MMSNPHLDAITRILHRDLPNAPASDRTVAAAELAAYIDQILAGQDAALRALKQDDHACGQISLAQARGALHAPPAVGVPRQRPPIATIHATDEGATA